MKRILIAIVALSAAGCATAQSEDRYSVALVRVQETEIVGPPAPDPSLVAFRVRLRIEKSYAGASRVRSFETTLVGGAGESLMRPDNVVVYRRGERGRIEVAHWTNMRDDGRVCLEGSIVERFGLEGFEPAEDTIESCFPLDPDERGARYSVAVASVRSLQVVGPPTPDYLGAIFRVRLRIERLVEGAAPALPFNASLIAGHEAHLSQPAGVVIVYRTDRRGTSVAHWTPVSEDGAICLGAYIVQEFDLKGLEARQDGREYCYRGEPNSVSARRR